MGSIPHPGTVSPLERVGYLGLDVSQDEAMACLLLPDGSQAARSWRVPNTQSGGEALAQRLRELAQQHGLTQVRIGLEATGLYWWHLACLLKDSPTLADLPHTVYALNPKLVHGLKKAYTDGGKTDLRDAFFVAERLRVGRLPAPFHVDVRYAPLQRLTRFRVHLAESLAREKNYFLSFLFLKFSAFTQVEPFGNPFGATSLAVLETFSTEELAQTDLVDLAAFVQQHGHGRFADPDALAATLQRAARDSYRLDKVLDEPLTVLLGTTMATIRTLQAQLAAVDKTIARELLALPADRRTIASVPGLGPVFTAGLVAEIGDIQRFPDDAAIAKYAGLVWKAHESGQFQAEDTALAKSGNAYLRYYLVEAANSVRLHCAEYQTYYATKLAQSPKHAHKRALVLTARKLVRLVDALLRAGTVYHEPRQDQKEVAPTPSTTRPRPQRRMRRVTSAH
ncbi:MAG: IS110 family transposase [Chloroflexota bacterium]|nr:IS110 family transposase [Chloroflexota bacterium]